MTKTIAQKISEVFAEHADGTADFARIEGFSGTEFEWAAKAAFEADKQNAEFGVVHINEVSKAIGGNIKHDADGTRHFVFDDGSALTEGEANGVFFYPVEKWVRNEDTWTVD